jgi:ketose-bisphosphate aldolase
MNGKLASSDNDRLVRAAWKSGLVVPGFNIPYLPMMEPVVRALRDTECFGLISVARLEWVKFGAGSLSAVRAEYARVGDERYTRLHVDHVPVIDEDDLRVDFMPVMREAIALGYGSVMIDGSRLPLEENIAATREVVEFAHGAGVAVEAELGMVLGHGEGPLPPYEELFRTGRGFTDPAEARRFVVETGVDWLSVAVGSAHGAISAARKDEKKVEARLNIGHLALINKEARVPLVLHGGTGIRKQYVMEGIRNGIAKINIGTAIRQPYQRALREGGEERGREAVYEETLRLIRRDLEMCGSARTVKSL